MAETTLLLNGFSIIGDPHTNTSASKGGNLLIHNGTAVFEGDDIVVFTVTNVDANGTLSGKSIVTGVTVYNNATDYYNDTPAYTYSGSAKIGNGRAHMGDRYLEFDASSLVSTNANAPVLGELTVVAGVDILGTLATTNGPLKVATYEDIDVNGDGSIDGLENADAAFSDDLNLLLVVCFASGTLIESATGLRAVETIAAGDLVMTLDDGLQPVRWAGVQTVSGTGPTAPVHIARGALGNIRPLVVSQNHRMLVSGARAEILFGQLEVLIAAKHLVNNRTIQIRPCAEVSYHHFMFENHQIVFAEGCPAESLYPGAQTLSTLPDSECDEIRHLLPEQFRSGAAMPVSRYELRGYEAAALHAAA